MSGPATGAPAPFAGAVLTGGASRRMGRDKAFVPAPDGRPMVLVAAEALAAAGATTVMVVGGDQAGADALGLEWRADLHPGEGPLGGILTALAETDEDLVVVLACDMPGVVAAVPAALVAALATAPTSGVAVAMLDEREQPLTACWRRSAAPVLERAFAAGERAPRVVLDDLGVVRVRGLEPTALVDVDSPDDLHLYAGSPLRPTTDQEPE